MKNVYACNTGQKQYSSTQWIATRRRSLDTVCTQGITDIKPYKIFQYNVTPSFLQKKKTSFYVKNEVSILWKSGKVI